MKKNLFIFLILIIFFSSCRNETKILINKHEKLYLESFKNTNDYELAKAIKDSSVRKIDEFLIHDKSIVERSYNENYYSVLHFAAELERTDAIKHLLRNGFNPNVKTISGETPLHIAAGFPSIVFYNSYRNCEVVETLLDYDADTEMLYTFQMVKDIESVPMTPLMSSIRNSLSFAASSSLSPIMPSMGMNDISQNRRKYVCLEKTKMLVEKGNADVNRKTTYDVTASILALYYGEIEKAHYLISQKKAQVTDVFYISEDNFNKKIQTRPVELLRKLLYPLDSEEYKLKQEIIEEFKRQGIDYYSEPIPDDVLDKIKRLYPKTWEEYIKVY